MPFKDEDKRKKYMREYMRDYRKRNPSIVLDLRRIKQLDKIFPGISNNILGDKRKKRKKKKKKR